MIRELIVQHWQYIAGYLAIGWLFGAALFRFAFIEKECSMGGNAGGNPLFYYKVNIAGIPQAIIYVIGMLLWPFTFFVLLMLGIIALGAYIMESKNRVFPCVVKWVFGWPTLLILRLCNKCVDDQKK